MKIRTTRDEWQIWGNYGHGWYEECVEDNRRDGLQRLKEYRENGSGAYQLRKRRIKL